MQKIPLNTTSFNSSNYVLMYNTSGDKLGISYADFITVLNSVLSVGVDSGTDSSFDYGDRMDGSGIYDCGNRIT